MAPTQTYPRRYLVLAAVCLALLVGYIHRNSIAVAEVEIRADLRLSKEEMGWVLGAFYASYAVLQIPAGWAVHRLGVRRSLPLWSVLGAAASAGCALVGGLSGLFAARLGLGAAQAGMLPAGAVSASRWFPASERGVASGVIGASLSVGGAIGSWVTAQLLPTYSWRLLFAVYALPGLAWAVWFLFWYRESPEQSDEVGPAAASPAPEPTPWGAILASPSMWLVCAQQFFRAAGYIFYATWFVTYLREGRGLQVDKAGLLTVLPLLGVVVGGLTGGWLTDFVLAQTGSRRLARRGVAATSLSLSALCVWLAIPVADSGLFAALLAAGSCCSGLSGACSYATTIDLGGRHVAPVFSTMNMAGNLGALAFPPLVAWLLGVSGSWEPVLHLFAAIHLAAAACWLVLDPSASLRSGRSEAGA